MTNLDAVRRAEILMEALPYIREFRGKTLVIKYGGAAMEQADLKGPVALDVILIRLLRAPRRPHRLPSGEEVDRGLVGRVEAVNPEPIRLLEESGFIPVIAPVGVGRNGETYNINADLVAGEVAAALG